MKKPSLNKDGIQQFFLANGEKLLLGVTALILFGFFYSALTAKPLDESMSPEAIKIASNNLQSQVNNRTWEDKKKELNLAAPEFEKSNEVQSKPIPATPFVATREWKPPLFPELKRRAEPKIFAVEEPQVASGVGLLALQIDPSRQVGVAAPPTTTATATPPKRIDPTAALPGAHAQSAEAEGRPYVVITGSVPIEKQTLEYNDKFSLAMPAELDPNTPTSVIAPQAGQPELPVYAICMIYRREVAPGMKADAPWPTPAELPPLNYNKVIEEMSKWSNAWANQDIVDPNYVFPCDEIPIPGFDPVKTPQSKGTLTRLITMPLPPLLLKDWGMEAAHPKIRLNIPDDAAATPGGTPGVTSPDVNLGFGDQHPAENPGGMKAPLRQTPAPRRHQLHLPEPRRRRRSPKRLDLRLRRCSWPE